MPQMSVIMGAYKEAVVASIDCNVNVYYDLDNIRTNKWMGQEWYNCIDDTTMLDTLLVELHKITYPVSEVDSVVEECLEWVDLFSSDYWYGDNDDIAKLMVIGASLVITTAFIY